MPAKLIRLATQLVILVIAVITTIWFFRAYLARGLSDLEVWHSYRIEAEFRAKDFPDGISFAEYRDLESRLFEELDAQIYAIATSSNGGTFSRYNKNGVAYPGETGQQWNRSFELPADNPQGGVLFIHGASDSPYSTRALSELLHTKGMYVVSVRLPGNGTIPSGLRDAKLADWLAITAMGVRQVRSAIGPELPVYVAGYSVGGALALDYALDAVGDENLEIPDRLFMFSPAIGVTPAARLSGWDVTLSNIPAFKKFAWLTVEPEFDPYKYNSFAKNAAHITYLLTERIRAKMSKLEAQDALSALPPIISFQSLVDSTVRTSVLVDEIYSRMPANGSELIIFDINRASDIEPFLHDADEHIVDDLEASVTTRFSYTLVTNASAETIDMVARSRAKGEQQFTTTPLGLQWPKSVYSMSHVAVPFPPDDRWYGNAETNEFALGALAPRGEVAALTIPIGRFMRLRYNPFFDYQAMRTLQFCAACAE